MSEKIRIGAVYSRASDQSEAEKEHGTLENQEFIGREMADQLTLESGIKHVIQYELTEEHGQSGGNTDRPQYQHLLHLIDTRKIDFIVAKEISRLNRSIKDFSELMERCKRNGVAVHIKGLNIPFEGAMGELVYKILALLAEFERKLIMQRTYEGIRAGALQNKKIHGGKILLGFDRDPSQTGVWIPNPAELILVERILDHVLQNDRAVSACKAIKAEGVKTKYGSEITPDALKRMVFSRKYEGIYELNLSSGLRDSKTNRAVRQKVADVQFLDKPVVSIEKLEAARAQMKVWDEKKPRVRKRSYLLSGLIEHTDGSPIKADAGTAKNGTKHSYYLNKDKRIRLKAEKIEREVVAAIGVYKDDAEIQQYANSAAYQLRSNVTVLDLQLAKRREAKKELKAKHGKLLDAFIGSEKTGRSVQWLDAQLSDLDHAEKELEKEILAMERERTVLLETRPDPKNMKAVLEFVFTNFEKADPSVQRNFIRQIIEKVVVINAHEIQIYWRFLDIKKPALSDGREAGGSGFVLDNKWGPDPPDNTKTETSYITAGCDSGKAVETAKNHRTLQARSFDP